MSDIKTLTLNNNSPISDQIYTHLRSLIIKTDIIPGTVISENALSSIFNVSRQPVRVALNLLERDDLIAVFPQKSTVVKKISVKNLKEVVFLRSAIECSCIDNIKNLSVQTYSSIIKDLQKNLEDQEKEVNTTRIVDNFFNLDDVFHENISKFSQCEMTWPLIQSFKGHLDRIRFLTMDTESPLTSLYFDHKEVFDAIINYDYDKAKDLLRDHLREIVQTNIVVKDKYASWFEE